ncbi:hypothetical protein SBA3_680019 [Candidatus Sulfopaludibacter sp. SbA3]|nr:hypothetical protein SBA3_680019 [Candidatus Sulfopaludibacter sp. SbA3]
MNDPRNAWQIQVPRMGRGVLSLRALYFAWQAFQMDSARQVSAGCHVKHFP